MKSLILILFFLLLTPKIYPQTQSEKWLEDYEILKKHLVEGYSNLDWIKQKGSVDIVSLDKETKEALTQTTSEIEVKDIFDKFLSVFNDGHLEIFENNKSLSDNKVKFDSNTTGKDLCSSIGNENVLTNQFSLPFEKHKSFKLVSTENDPFPTGIFTTDNGKQFAVLRISVFSPDFYTRNCEELWDLYKKSLDNECDNECLDNFSLTLANSLLEKLNQQLENLKKYKFEALIVDIGDNGGGTSWVEAIARTLASKSLFSSKFALVKHPKSVEIFENQLKEVNSDLQRTDLNNKEKKLLISAKKSLEILLEQAHSNCDNSMFWSSNTPLQTCSNTTSTPFYASGIFPYLNKSEIKNLKSKSVLFSPSEYNYKESLYKGKLIVLINRNTASAAEYFAALLKDNNMAIILGEKSYGAGGGFVNGGVEYILPYTNFLLKMPNCTRYRKDGSNEFEGVETDIPIWKKTDDLETKLDKLLNVLQNLNN